MSDRFTSIDLPNCFGSGLAEYGRKTPAEMIAAIRSYAEHKKAVAEAILAADDNDFYIATYEGVHVRRNREIIQNGRATVIDLPVCEVDVMVGAGVNRI